MTSTPSTSQDALAASFYQRLANRLTLGALVLCAILVWAGHGTLRLALADGTLPLLLGAAAAFALLIGALFLRTIVTPLISRPAAALADAAEAVAAGDLTVALSERSGAGQLARLRCAVARMVGALREVVLALRTTSHDAAALASEITASADDMAARAQETAHTSVALSRQSATMAGTIEEIAADAVRLTDIAAEVAMGAHEGVNRNRHLRDVAAASRDRLDASTQALARLGDEIRESAGAVGELAAASEEIRSFVTLVAKMAKQSKLLALNAAMEAARAGEQGDGFAVVATEVRRLATDSTAAARRSEAAVAAILERVEMSRTLTARTVATVDTVLAATRAGEAAYRGVEEAVAAAEEWTQSVEQAAALSSGHVQDITVRLDGLAKGTQAFAAAMGGVAASSEEQSASTQEIASAANTLAGAAEHLAQLVGTFRLPEGAAGGSAGITDPRLGGAGRPSAYRPTPMFTPALG